MRPLSLRIAGLTSFRDEQEVDFRDVDLFAITGPTGSGKSSILDALTYALYGRVERVGDRVSQLISQGQPAMRAILEFEVAGRAYRVTRRTPAGGASKILFERRDGDEWVSAGPGADRVRDTEAAIVELVGLDYSAFTRSIMLPQGQFAQFLSGEAAERRRILAELLGLEIYGRMARQAGDIAGTAQQGAVTREQLLATDFADANDQALAEARRAHRDAQTRENKLRRTREAVAGLVARARANADRRASLERLGGDIATLDGKVAAAQDRLSAAAAELAATESDFESAQRRVEETEAAVREATGAAKRLESEVGSSTALAEQLAGARELAEQQSRIAQLRSDIEDECERRSSFEAGLRRAEESLKQEQESERQAADGVERAGAAMLDAVRHQRGAALLVGLHPGDPCPACGRPLTEVSEPVGGDEIDAAKRAKTAADAALKAAHERVMRALTAVTDTKRGLDQSIMRSEALSQELDGREERAKLLRSSLGMLADLAPEEIVASLQAKLAQIEEGRRQLDAARGAADDARAAQRSLAEERESIVNRVHVERAKLQQLADTGTKSVVEDQTSRVLVAQWPAGSDFPDHPEPLAAKSLVLRDALAEAAAAVAGAIQQTKEVDDRLLEEALGHADGTETAGSLEELSAELEDSHRAVTATLASSEASIGHLRARIEARRKLEKEAAELRRRANAMHAIAQQLRSDRLVAFVIEEALDALARSASRHLEQLSDGRYRLASRQDDFKVVDTWNGDEHRNVRTLSGGETFLASLALALALADQVAVLGVGRRARLDSLFLDEGFGTLDPETLDVVIAAIETLGADGRMVGVVTHVPELADRLPVRLRVVKSPRGSHIVRDEDSLSRAPAA